MDDDFSSTTLGSHWTVTHGAVGTVDPFATNSSAIYDLTSVPDTLAVQADDNTFSIRQDHTLADGESVVLTLSPAINISSNLSDEVVAGITLNSDDSSPVARSGNGYISIQFRATNDGWVIQMLTKDSAGATLDEALFGGGSVEKSFNGNKMQFRIARKDVGASAQYMCSFNFGGVFVPIKKMQTGNSAFNNVWIRVASYENYTNSRLIPIQLFHSIQFVPNTEIVV